MGKCRNVWERVWLVISVCGHETLKPNEMHEIIHRLLSMSWNFSDSLICIDASERRSHYLSTSLPPSLSHTHTHAVIVDCIAWNASQSFFISPNVKCSCQCTFFFSLVLRFSGVCGLITSIRNDSLVVVSLLLFYFDLRWWHSVTNECEWKATAR